MILCVDRNETRREARTRLLRAEGLEVIEVASGTDALRLSAEKRPSLILLEIQLPDGDGFAVCAQLKSNPETAAIPVVHISETPHAQSRQSGAEAYLEEPIEPSVLAALVKALLRAASAEQRAAILESDAEGILEGAAEAMFLLNQDFRFTHVNRMAERMLGMDRISLLGRVRSEVFPEAAGTKADIEFHRVMRDRTPSSFETYYAPWQKWYQVDATPLRAGGLAVRAVDITQRKKEEEERQRLLRDLAERTDELQTILDAAPVAIWISNDPSCNEIVGNRMADAICEAQPGDNVSATASPLGRRIFCDGRELAPQDLPMQKSAAEGTEIRGAELDLLLPSGRHIHMLGNASPLRNASGEVRGCVGAFLDITQRQSSERALRESEERYRRLFTRMNEGFAIGEAIYDEKGAPLDIRLLEMNDAFERQTGVTREILGLPLRDLFPRLEPEWIEKSCRVALSGESLRFGAHNRDRDFSVFCYSHARGRFAVLLTDITDLKRAERALAEAVQRLDAHMDNSPLAVIEFDPEFRVIRWSKEATRVFGWRADEILGRAIAEMRWVLEEDLEKVASVSRDMLEGKQPRNVGVNRNYRKDGSIIECEWYNSAIYDSEGRLASILSQVLDITERKRTEERLRRAQKMESVAVLAGGVAHDFNNLLVGVIGSASLAMEMMPPDSPAQELLARVLKSGEQAAHLTRQMLAYSGKGRFVVEPVDLSEVVREVMDLVRSTAPKKIAMELEFDPELPRIEADRGQIHQVLMNLVINATEAIGNEPGLIAVQTGVRTIDEQFVQDLEGWDIGPGTYVFLEVRDTGCGMDEGTKARIFDPFFTTKFQGRGLGLAAVGGIIRGHRGAIHIRTAPGSGTSFLLLFPAGQAAPDRRVPELGRVALCLSEHGPILVVDDDPSIRNMVKLSLERRGCEVRVASSGLQAVEMLKREAGNISLAILDVSMPSLSGQEVLPQLLAISPGLKALVSSGYPETAVMPLFEGLPVCGFIQKPYTVERLVRQVQKALGRNDK